MRRLLLVLWLAALVQAYFLSVAFGTKFVPNLVLVIWLAAAWQLPSRQVLISSLWAGLWLDVASYSQFGLKTAAFALMAALVVWLRRTGLELRPLVLATVIVSATLVYNQVILLATTTEVGHWISPVRYLGWWAAEAALNLGFAWWLSSRVKLVIGRQLVRF